MSSQATRNAKDRSDPDACVQRYLEVFEVAKDHARRMPSGSQLVAYRSLARWAGMHSTVAAMGLMRKPVELNRNQAVLNFGCFRAVCDGTEKLQTLPVCLVTPSASTSSMRQ